jgi:hypothetical protein
VDGDFFAFDLSSVETYLVADVVLKGAPRDLRWLPAPVSWFSSSSLDSVEGRKVAEARAAVLGLPLHWPTSTPWVVPGAMRAAYRAAELGVGGGFMQLASRLRFAGGFDLESQPLGSLRIAGAEGIDLSGLTEAISDKSLDERLQATAFALSGASVARLPALRVQGRLACGELAILELVKRLGPRERSAPAATSIAAAPSRGLARLRSLSASFRGMD